LGEHAGMVDMEATLFVDVLAAAAADVAIRALLVTVIPAPTTIEDFMRSDTYQPLSTAHEPAAIVLNASIQFIKCLAKSVQSKDWMKYRIFLNLIGHPVERAGENDEIEPNWMKESDWIQSSIEKGVVSIVWKEFESAMTCPSNILLLLVSKAFPSVEEVKEALCIPSSYVLGKFPGFCEELIRYAFANHRHLHRAFNVLQVLLVPEHSSYSSLDHFSTISIVLIEFLISVSQQENIGIELIGCFILLILQLEERKAPKSNAAVASEWMRRDKANKDQVDENFD